MTYASNTVVSVEKSRAELEKMLERAGATQRGFMIDDEGGRATVVFRLKDRQVRLLIPLPKLGDFKTKKDPRYSYRTLTPEKQRLAFEQACRTRWRQMCLLVKAKLEAVELGFTTVEREFLADIFLPDGRTVHQALVEDIEQAYLTGKMPPLLGPASEGT